MFNQQHLGLLSLVFLLVAFSRWLEGRFKFLETVGSAVVCTVIGMLLGNLGIIPQSGPFNDTIYALAVPYAIVLIIFSSNLRDLKRAGGRMLACFTLATAATMAGCVVATVLFRGWIGTETWKIGGAFAGSFVGGGMNFVAVGQALAVSPSLFGAAAVADNLSTVPYFLAQIGIAAWLAPLYARHARPARQDGAATATAGVGDEDPRRYWTSTSLTMTDLALLAAVPVLALYVSGWLSALLPGVPQVLWLTTIALAAAQVPLVRRLNGAAVIAYFALHVFFLVLGASSILAEVVKAGPAIVLFMVTILTVHAVVVYVSGWLLRFDMATLAVASQAAIGGPDSALALSMSLRAAELQTPGIIVGILGYAVGTYLGLGCAAFLR